MENVLYRQYESNLKLNEHLNRNMERKKYQFKGDMKAN